MNLFWLFHKKIRLDRVHGYALASNSFSKQIVALHAMEDWATDEGKFISVTPTSVPYWYWIHVKEQCTTYEYAVNAYCTRIFNTHKQQRMGVDGVVSFWRPRKWKNVYSYARHVESLLEDLKKKIQIDPR